MKPIAYMKYVAIAAFATMLLAGCGTRHVSRDISPDGHAGEVRFPDPAGVVLKEGTFPNLDNLRTVAPGVTKDQLYHLLGRPHFREGYAGVREWDYLFHFHVGGDVVTCQYKVIFDRDYRGQSFHWAPAACADVLSPVAAGAEAIDGGTRYSLSSDVLFAFARYGLDDIQQGGRAELSRIAAQIANAPGLQIRVVGHTDRIGGDADNMLLSHRRASSVREFLIGEGIDPHAITAYGEGGATPVTSGCGDDLPRDELVRCLAPDRRVELSVTGLGNSRG